MAYLSLKKVSFWPLGHSSEEIFIAGEWQRGLVAEFLSGHIRLIFGGGLIQILERVRRVLIFIH